MKLVVQGPECHFLGGAKVCIPGETSVKLLILAIYPGAMTLRELKVASMTARITLIAEHRE